MFSHAQLINTLNWYLVGSTSPYCNLLHWLRHWDQEGRNNQRGTADRSTSFPLTWLYCYRSVLFDTLCTQTVQVSNRLLRHTHSVQQLQLHTSIPLGNLCSQISFWLGHRVLHNLLNHLFHKACTYQPDSPRGHCSVTRKNVLKTKNSLKFQVHGFITCTFLLSMCD